MDKKTILPFETHPFCLCYHNLAFPFSVIQGNGNICNVDVVSWMLRKFTNCVFDDNMKSNRYEICLCDAWGVIDCLTKHQNINFSKSTYELLEIDILSFVKKLIDATYYITGMYNEKYIKGKRAYKEYDYWHDYIIFGYDDEKSCVYSAGFLEKGQFEVFEISYEAFLTSISCDEGRNIQFNLYWFNKNAPVKFNVIRITNLLKDYINSTTQEGQRLKGFYGIEANIKLKEFFKKSFDDDNESEINSRYSRAFMEHKFFIKLAINSLCERSYLNLSKSQKESIDLIYRKANIIHLLGLKIGVSKKNSLINKIVMHFEDIERIEKELLPTIVNMLEKNLPDTV